MDIVGFITGQNLFDLLFIFVLFAAFILGWVQGTIRRLLGIASILFSFLLAANLRDPLGKFFAENWTQFPAEYSYMLSFLIVFIVGSVAFSIIIQGFYKRQDLFAKATIVDEVLGGILGIVQALLIFGCLIVILDSYYRIPGIATDPDELPFLQSFYDAYTNSGIAEAFRTTLIPVFFALFGWLIPNDIEAYFPGFGD